MSLLREYQSAALIRINAEFAAGRRFVLVKSPTGSGKTVLFAEFARQRVERGQRGLVLVHRRELLDQATKKLRDAGLAVAVTAAGRPSGVGAVTVATVQTLVRRAVPDVQFVINDEAHLSTATTWQTILDALPRADVLGVTATPSRLSGRPLSEVYQSTVEVATSADLRDAGWLAPYLGFSYEHPDIALLKTRAGEFTDDSVDLAMSNSGIVDNILEMYAQRSRDLSAVLFAANVRHSKELATKFQAAGVRTEHVDGGTPKAQRDRVIRDFAAGHIRVLCNVGIAVEGLDVPRAKCCILARPTKSLVRYLQSVGRVMRPWEGQTARIHDHAFCVAMHGLPDDEHDFVNGSGRATPDVLSLFQCKKCFGVFKRAPCPACGPAADPLSRPVKLVEPTQIQEFDATKVPTQVRWETPGRLLEGIFEESGIETTHFGIQKFYILRGEKRRYRLPGTTMLDRLLSRVPTNDYLWVTYEGRKDAGNGRRYHSFKIETEARESAPASDIAPVWEPPEDPFMETEHGNG